MRSTDRDPARARRRATFLAGHWAEWMAVVALIFKGYRILARRYATRGGEIDIVALRGGIVAFVEVKARPTHDAALLAVTEQKRRRIERAAAVWLARNPWATAYVLRGDAMVVTPAHWPVHVAEAYVLRIG